MSTKITGVCTLSIRRYESSGNGHLLSSSLCFRHLDIWSCDWVLALCHMRHQITYRSLPDVITRPVSSVQRLRFTNLMFYAKVSVFLFEASVFNHRSILTIDIDPASLTS